MKSVEEIQSNNAELTPVIATGCPHSGWEVVSTALQQFDLEMSGEAFFDWLKHSLSSLDLIAESKSEQSLSLSEKEMDFVESDALYSDSKNIWLLETWAEKFPQARFILFYTSVETALSSAIRDGIKPESFINTWSQVSREIVRFQRRHRDRAVLFNAESVFDYFSVFADKCKRIGLSCDDGVNNAVTSEQVSNDSIERILARRFLIDVPESLALQQEMEASAIPLGEISGIDSLSTKSLLDAYFAQQERVSLLLQEQSVASETISEYKQTSKVVNKKHDGLVRENELLLLQLQQVQGELDSIYKSNQASKIKNQKLESSLLNIEGRLESAHLEIDARKEALTKKKLELLDVNIVLESQIKVSKELERNQEKIEELERVKNISDKENAFLLLQLHQLQEELEHYSKKYQEILEKENSREVEDDTADVKKVLEEKHQEISGSTSIFPQDIKLTLSGKSGNKRKIRKARTNARKKEQENISLVKRSGLFDERWYRNEYPDVAEAELDPVKHYLRYGADEDRDPSASFSTRYYAGSNPDIPRDKINPLVHYIRFGREEGRFPTNYGFNH